MPAIHIRDVPEDVLEALKRRAASNERSLQGELRHILATIARQEPAGAAMPPIQLHFSDAQPETSWSREEIYGDDAR